MTTSGWNTFFGTSWKNQISFHFKLQSPVWVPAGGEEEFSTNIFTAPSQEFLRHTLHSIIIVNLSRQIEQVGIWGEWKSFWLVLTFFISKCNYQTNYSQCLALRVAQAQQTIYFLRILEIQDQHEIHHRIELFSCIMVNGGWSRRVQQRWQCRGG